MKLTKNIALRELVPTDVINQYGEQKAFWLIDPKIPYLLQKILELCVKTYGTKTSKFSIIINTPTLQNRGWRPRSYKTKTELSQHFYGRASDFNITIDGKMLTEKQVFDVIMSNESVLFGTYGLTAVEDIEVTKGWVHIDVRPRMTGQTRILIVRP